MKTNALYVRDNRKFAFQLPSIVSRKDGTFIFPESSPHDFVEDDLNVTRLNNMHQWLWLAGRVGNIRPLHRQIMMGRRILITEQADLHLLWHNDFIFMKPFPDYMLDGNFVRDIVYSNSELETAALGLLRTYILLICRESDFVVAKKNFLVPETMRWQDWKSIVSEMDSRLLQHLLNAPGLLNKCPRYHYGELRLNRINFLYKWKPPYRLVHIFRGYYYSYGTYSSLIQNNFAWVITAFVAVGLVLSAMQVGLATSHLENNYQFNNACFGLAVAAILIPCFVLSSAAALSMAYLIFNLGATMSYTRRALCKGESFTGA